ncbi:MAG: DUF169 domain-containing protein [Deltaproteobacteria bacterium]|nr:DUF169 domain-containing protein [Deltaproteobacteria bacterium]
MDYQKCYDTIFKTIMPQSFPIGVKIIKKDEPFPEKAVRPAKFKIKISLCQWTTIARKWGWVVGAMGEDINCTPCLAAFGFKQVPDIKDVARFFMSMGYTKTEEQALSMAENVEYRTPGDVKGVVMFPLNKAPMPPDLVMIYGMPAQMFRLASGLFYTYGKSLTSQSHIGLSCLHAAMPYWNQEPAFTNPGRGERMLAATGDTEMCLSLPAKYVNDLTEGLEATQKTGTRYPVQNYLLYNPPKIPPMRELETHLLDIE